MKLKLIQGGGQAPKSLPNIPSLSEPHTDLAASIKAVMDIRLFVQKFIEVDKILGPLKSTREHPIEAVYLIRFSHELHELRCFWLGLLDDAEVKLRAERAARKMLGGER